MGRVGKNKKKVAGSSKEAAKANDGMGADAGYSKPASSGFSGGAGFTEQDVEFMKKAIQVLC
jgi:hypothetical protein